MKRKFVFFSAVVFLWIITLQGYSSQNFSVSVGFGGGAIEVVEREGSATETALADPEIEHVVFGMPYCMSSDQYYVEVVYATGTDLIDIPEPAAWIRVCGIILILYRKLMVSANAKEKRDE